MVTKVQIKNMKICIMIPTRNDSVVTDVLYENNDGL